jgi:L-rhamnose mutarotase
MTTRHCFALDLKDDPQLIEAYKVHHNSGNVWPEIIESIKSSDIKNLDIYLVGNRLFMIMDVNNEFSFTSKEKADLTNPKVIAWEELMWTFQQKLPWAKGDEKWMLMEQIFTLK